MQYSHLTLQGHSASLPFAHAQTVHSLLLPLVETLLILQSSAPRPTPLWFSPPCTQDYSFFLLWSHSTNALRIGFVLSAWDKCLLYLSLLLCHWTIDISNTVMIHASFYSLYLLSWWELGKSPVGWDSSVKKKSIYMWYSYWIIWYHHMQYPFYLIMLSSNYIFQKYKLFSLPNFSPAPYIFHFWWITFSHQMNLLRGKMGLTAIMALKERCRIA